MPQPLIKKKKQYHAAVSRFLLQQGEGAGLSSGFNAVTVKICHSSALK